MTGQEPEVLVEVSNGVGRLTLVDPDLVAAHNLHRQVLYTAADMDKPKAEVARRRLLALDASLDIEVRPFALDPGNAPALIAGGPRLFFRSSCQPHPSPGPSLQASPVHPSSHPQTRPDLSTSGENA